MKCKVITAHNAQRLESKLGPGYGLHENKITITLLGDTKSGKSSLMQRFVKNNFNDELPSTIGAAYHSQLIELKEKNTKIEFWDTSGQEQFHTISYSYGNCAQAIIIVFDLLNRKSFDYASDLIKARKELFPKSPSIILIANKCESPADRKIEPVLISNLIKDDSNGIDVYVETSAKTGENVDAAIFAAAEHAMMQLKLVEPSINTAEQDIGNLLSVRLDRYITRIESHQNSTQPGQPDFAHGFWFFSKSRALNRQANYFLAEKLRDDLHRLATIPEIFAQANEKRDTIIKQYRLHERDGWTNRGINSSELKAILKDAMKTSNEAESDKTPLLSLERAKRMG